MPTDQFYTYDEIILLLYAQALKQGFGSEDSPEWKKISSKPHDENQKRLRKKMTSIFASINERNLAKSLLFFPSSLKSLLHHLSDHHNLPNAMALSNGITGAESILFQDSLVPQLKKDKDAASSLMILADALWSRIERIQQETKSILYQQLLDKRIIALGYSVAPQISARPIHIPSQYWRVLELNKNSAASDKYKYEALCFAVNDGSSGYAAMGQLRDKPSTPAMA